MSTTTNDVEFSLHEGIATLTLNRPGKRNALTIEMIENISMRVEEMYESQVIRLVIFRAEGSSFCAGADIQWMEDSAQKPESVNQQEAFAMAKMFRLINELNKPTVGVIQGNAFGGGLGLVACFDVVLASKDACFCLPEARLGLVPAVIGPFLQAKIGESALRHLMLRGHIISAEKACQLGIVHELYTPPDFQTALDIITKELLQGGPNAQAAAKKLMLALNDHYMDGHVDRATAELIAKLRKSTEGQEGLNAFLGQRKPKWVK